MMSSPIRCRDHDSVCPARPEPLLVSSLIGRSLARSRLSVVAGMERLDRVQVATAGGVVTLPWSSRFELLERVRRFEAVGATLDWDSKLLLLNVLAPWLNEAGGNELPP